MTSVELSLEQYLLPWRSLSLSLSDCEKPMRHPGLEPESSAIYVADERNR